MLFVNLLVFLLLIRCSYSALLQGLAQTTRYWDCCKPSCAWPDKGNVHGRLRYTDRQGRAIEDPLARSGCDGGGVGFADPLQVGFAVNKNLAYGFAAAHVQDRHESELCGKCFKLTFTDTTLRGKKMVVQVTNTGYDLGQNHFDLAMPGGGQGLFNGCSAQFTQYKGGNQYGGITRRQECQALPLALRPGCYFRFDWFMNADNPHVNYTQVSCPRELVQRSHFYSNEF